MAKIRYHIVFWICYFLYCYLSDLIIDDTTTLGNELVLFLSHNIFIFYALNYFFNTFSKRTNKELVVSIIKFIIIVFVFYVLRFIGRYYILTKYFDPDFSNMPYDRCIAIGATWIVQYFFFSSAYFYFRNSIQKQKDLALVIQEKFIEQQQKLELENSLLKSQINPHFLYNSLNFLYAKSLPLSAELSNGIIKLSEIMRYSLQPHDVDGLVLLSDEAEHIRNVIEMAQLRFSNRVFIEFNCYGDIDDVRIIPLALITLVENVLKHGVINDQETPARIDLKMVNERSLKFRTWNRKRIGPKELSTGIGLNNALKRLQNTYSKDCAVKISDGNDDFGVDLTIDFKLTPTTNNVC